MKTQDSPCKRVIVLDTSAFVAGFDSFSLIDEQFTVPKVEEEIRRNSMIKMRLEAAIESGKLKIKTPTQESAAKAEVSANKVGDSSKLSETDKQLLSLALEFKDEGFAPKIVTDDYSIQNVATQMGIEFLSLATLGIKRLLEWVRYCPACYKEYAADSKFKECLVCGTELKRKPKRPKNSSGLKKPKQQDKQ
jgi:UPF0271 protein